MGSSSSARLSAPSTTNAWPRPLRQSCEGSAAEGPRPIAGHHLLHRLRTLLVLLMNVDRCVTTLLKPAREARMVGMEVGNDDRGDCAKPADQVCHCLLKLIPGLDRGESSIDHDPAISRLHQVAVHFLQGETG
jgi:hypothetical protein